MDLQIWKLPNEWLTIKVTSEARCPAAPCRAGVGLSKKKPKRRFGISGAPYLRQKLRVLTIGRDRRRKKQISDFRKPHFGIWAGKFEKARVLGVLQNFLYQR